jgi:hypothetical protein
MQQQEKSLTLLCDILSTILLSYQATSWMPQWLFRRWHKRMHQVRYLVAKIHAIKAEITADSYKEIENDLIKTLDRERFFFATHTQSHRLREKIQDAMLEVLFFQPDHVDAYKKFVLTEKNVEKFLKYLDQSESINAYKKHYRRQRAIYGRFIENFSEEEITLAAKGGMINGKLLQRYGVYELIAHGLHYIRNELKSIEKQKITAGYLSPQAIEGYVEKLDFLLHPANAIVEDEAALVQNARYLLEDIVNSAGVETNAKARNKIHQDLINACYWVDEMFLVAKGKLTAESLLVTGE